MAPSACHLTMVIVQLLQEVIQRCALRARQLDQVLLLADLAGSLLAGVAFLESCKQVDWEGVLKGAIAKGLEPNFKQTHPQAGMRAWSWPPQCLPRQGCRLDQHTSPFVLQVVKAGGEEGLKGRLGVAFMQFLLASKGRRGKWVTAIACKYFHPWRAISNKPSGLFAHAALPPSSPAGLIGVRQPDGAMSYTLSQTLSNSNTIDTMQALTHQSSACGCTCHPARCHQVLQS